MRERAASALGGADAGGAMRAQPLSAKSAAPTPTAKNRGHRALKKSADEGLAALVVRPCARVRPKRIATFMDVLLS
jgi:hypothetical protein